MTDPDLTAAWAYETELVAKLFEPWARRAVEVAKPLTGEVVLDLASMGRGEQRAMAHCCGKCAGGLQSYACTAVPREGAGQARSRMPGQV